MIRRTLGHVSSLAGLLLALLLLGSCGGGQSSGLDPQAATLARERAAARYERGDLAGARAELEPLLAASSPAREDLVRAAKVAYARRELDQAKNWLERAAASGGPPDAELAFLRARVEHERGRGAEAVERYRAALALTPEDHAARLMLATALNELDRAEEAEREYRVLLAVGLDNGGSWYTAAVYQLWRLMRATAQDEQAAELAARWDELSARGALPPSEALLRLGSSARLGPPAPTGTAPRPSADAPRFEPLELALPELADALEVTAHDLDGDLRMDVLARTPDGLVVARWNGAEFDARRVLEGPVSLARAFDLDNDADLDLVVATDVGVRFLVGQAGAFELSALNAPTLAATPDDLMAVDHDHDGDLDLLLVGAFGARLWRNDGAWVEDGAFTDVSVEAGLPAAPAFTWCTTEDLDGDQDVDLLFGGPLGAVLADNLRGGRFALEVDRFEGGLASERAPLVADLDGDARVDVWAAGSPATLWRQGANGELEREVQAQDAPAQFTALDLDLDGALDVVWDGGALLAPGLTLARHTALEGWPQGAPSSALCFADFDGDRRVDALRVAQGEVTLLRGAEGGGNAILVRLLGTKDNRRAVGAVFELRAGPVYRRVYYRGEPELAGIGPLEDVDVFRIRWPNGVTQTALDRGLDDYTMGDAAAGTPIGELSADVPFGQLQQQGELIGSCPFLYAWDGESYGFITDVLGITPLGLPMGPGMMVPPDHDEYVLVSGEQLRPRDGRLELQITEELREVTYLDRARLEVVDHPAGSEVFPDERFTFPPFPAPHVHTVVAPLAPTRALGSDGRDWAPELEAQDDVHAVPFTKHPPQFQGMTEPWFLELEFDAEEVRAARDLRLVMTGWLRWSNASANMAAARHPGVDFVPPILQVPDAEGGWRDTGPPVGFPAGKTKTMVIDLSQLDLASDPRLRVACTLEMYWDRIALAVCGDDAELVTQSLEPIEARLWERGFSLHLPPAHEDLPERFDWERLAPHPKWDQHAGAYTRFGDCLELTATIDDRFVIMASGDALTLAFDARGLTPPPDGYVRDYLLFLDGWAKDRDPNTVEALAVEPLPFHGMSGYPYGPDERFPDDEEHRRWRAEWNTRAAHRWVTPLTDAR